MITASLFCFIAGLWESIASASNALFIQHRRIKCLFFNSYFLIFIWVCAVKQLTGVMSGIVLTFFYATGYAIGSVLAVKIHDKIHRSKK